MNTIICNKSSFILLFFIVFIIKISIAQERLCFYKYEPLPYSLDKSSEKGYDKSGRKSGKWEQVCGFDCPLFFKDSTVILETSFGIGFYVDGLKQGMWDVYDKENYDERKLIAQIFFDKGMIVFQLTFIDNAFDNFTRIGCIDKPTNNGVEGDVISLDKIYFDKDNNLYRESYTPNGVLKKYPYPKKP